jgi:hypothetical protein
MATQRLVLLKLVGESGRLVTESCRAWAAKQQAAPDDPDLGKEIGRFAEVLDAHRAELPVVYYSEWLDRWSMGDDIGTPFTERGGIVLKANGPFYQVCCTDQLAALLTLPPDGWQFDEQKWLAVRLREAAAAWEPLIQGGTLLLLRRVVGASTDDDEIRAAAESVPGWLGENIPP